MPASLRRIDEASRQAIWLQRRLADQVRRARLRSGLSQRTVAAAVGCHEATISRLERSIVDDIRLRDLARIASVLGLVLRADLFPVGSALRDAGQLRVLNRLRPHVAPPLQWLLEVPVGPDDLRALDAAAVGPSCRIGLEVWSRVHDVQAQARLSRRKQADARMDRLILVFADTAANRSAVREAGAALRGSFPLVTRQVLAALRKGRDPGADGIVFI